jgi:hypothetical protein
MVTKEMSEEFVYMKESWDIFGMIERTVVGVGGANLRECVCMWELVHYKRLNIL